MAKMKVGDKIDECEIEFRGNRLDGVCFLCGRPFREGETVTRFATGLGDDPDRFAVAENGCSWCEAGSSCTRKFVPRESVVSVYQYTTLKEIEVSDGRSWIQKKN